MLESSWIYGRFVMKSRRFSEKEIVAILREAERGEQTTGEFFANRLQRPDGSWFYFVHSYYVIPDDPSIIATTTEYGYEFCSAIWKDNVFACQYHPEKSQDVGLKVLENFKGLTER